MRKEHSEAGDPLPSKVPPGPDNPLGAHMMTLGWPSYLIHGTNKPYGVGMRSSHGCMRFYPEDIAELYDKIPVGTKVTVVNQPFVFGWHDDAMYVQAFPVLEDDEREHPKAADALLNAAISDEMWQKVKQHDAAIDLELVNSLVASRAASRCRCRSAKLTVDGFVADRAPRRESRARRCELERQRRDVLARPKSSRRRATERRCRRSRRRRRRRRPPPKPAAASGGTSRFALTEPVGLKPAAHGARAAAKAALCGRLQPDISPSSDVIRCRGLTDRGARMRILMISDVYFPRINGVSTSIQTFRRGLHAAGHETVLIAPEYPARCDADRETDILRVPSRYLPRDPEDRVMKLGAMRALRPQLERRSFDLVHIQTPFIAHYQGVSSGARAAACRSSRPITRTSRSTCITTCR